MVYSRYRRRPLDHPKRRALRPGPELEPEDAIPKKKKKDRGVSGGTLTKTPPAAKVRDYDAHVLVCEGGDCKKRGAKQTRKALKGELRAEGINPDVRVDPVGCLGLCKHGPNVVVYHGAKPGGTWYLGLDEADVPEVVGQHLKDGEPVERLAAEFRPRKKAKK